MVHFLVVLVILKLTFVLTDGSVLEDVPSLPFCPNESVPGLVLVSTLDGKLSAINSTGSLVWQIDTGPGPLLISNIHKLELTNSGEWIRIIPSLTGTLYKFDGITIDPIPINAEVLLKSSFRYSDDLIIAGGIEVRTYGVGFRTGTLYYECSAIKCSNNEKQDVDDLLLIERSTHTVRAVEPRTGSERWNFSVGLHNIKLPRISCIDVSAKLFDWNLTATLPEGKLRASAIYNNVEYSWQYIFNAPIVRVWRWDGKDLTEVNLFTPRNIPHVVSATSLLPSIYIGMHNKQLYIHESSSMQNILNKVNTNLIVTESTSIAKIPWKPIPASTEVTEDDSTALSVLNASEYVNGNGYYLYTETDLRQKDSLLCEPNNSSVETLEPEVIMAEVTSFYADVSFWWKEFCLIVVTSVLCNYLLRRWNQRYQQQEIIIIERPVQAQISTEQKFAEKYYGGFTSRYVNDFDTLRCLGKGGFGVVFEVKQKIDECSYAIKRITLPDDPNSRTRVMREVKALANLDHQNIVRYFCSWVERPPMGWQQDHDKNLIGDRSFLSSEGTTHVTSTDHSLLQKIKRNKSASVSIDILSNGSKESIPNLDDSIDRSDDDSFIVFEGSAENGKIFASTPINLEENSTATVSQSSVLSQIEMTDISQHPKKINWKRPRRRHRSWDLTQNDRISLQPQKPPVYLYIQMQLCQKDSLMAWLNNNQDRDCKYVLDIFLQILKAVEYVHIRGLIHRDLKPSNILFSLNGQVKVGDFGLVKDMEDSFDSELIKKGTSPGYRGHTIEVGTQLYMSPEQFYSRIYDYKVDVYSLGLILFELLVPFSTTMERIKTLTDLKKNKFPEDFVLKFPDEHKLIKNMLSQDPNKRLTTIGVRARPPFNEKIVNYPEEAHYRLNIIYHRN